MQWPCIDLFSSPLHLNSSSTMVLRVEGRAEGGDLKPFKSLCCQRLLSEDLASRIDGGNAR